jgi:mannan endo-1,4-beta-mannosidase
MAWLAAAAAAIGLVALSLALGWLARAWRGVPSAEDDRSARTPTGQPAFGTRPPVTLVPAPALTRFRLVVLLVGLVALLFATLAPLAERILQPAPSFIRVQGTAFIKNGRPWRFVGANTNHIWEPALFNAERILDEAVQLGIEVVRIFPYAEQFYPFDRTAEDQREVERYWRELDHVLDLARRRDLRVILAPTWDYVGIILTGDPRQGDRNHYRFMTDPRAVERYQRFWTYLAERRNTVNGRRYRDDPTILGYNVINEWEVADAPGRLSQDEVQAAVARWFEEMAAHIKRVAPNQLVGSGVIGDDQPGIDFVRIHRAPSIDFATVHVYPHQRPPEWLAERARLAREQVGKPIVLQEGMAQGDDTAKAAYIERYWSVAVAAGFSGVMFWDWQTSEDGYQVFPTDRQTVAAIRRVVEQLRRG